MKKRFFTLDQARSLLPEVRRLVGQMVLLSAAMEVHKEAVQALSEKGAENSGSPQGTDYVEKLLVLQSCIARLQDMGCVVKGVEEGLVDFPHLRGGREVYLCWKYDERDILYWHETDQGFAGRTPIEPN